MAPIKPADFAVEAFLRLLGQPDQRPVTQAFMGEGEPPLPGNLGPEALFGAQEGPGDTWLAGNPHGLEALSPVARALPDHVLAADPRGMSKATLVTTDATRPTPCSPLSPQGILEGQLYNLLATPRVVSTGKKAPIRVIDVTAWVTENFNYPAAVALLAPIRDARGPAEPHPVLYSIPTAVRQKLLTDPQALKDVVAAIHYHIANRVENHPVIRELDGQPGFLDLWEKARGSVAAVLSGLLELNALLSEPEVPAGTIPYDLTLLDNVDSVSAEKAKDAITSIVSAKNEAPTLSDFAEHVQISRRALEHLFDTLSDDGETEADALLAQALYRLLKQNTPRFDDGGKAALPDVFSRIMLDGDDEVTIAAERKLHEFIWTNATISVANLSQFIVNNFIDVRGRQRLYEDVDNTITTAIFLILVGAMNKVTAPAAAGDSSGEGSAEDGDPSEGGG